jgi:ferric-dicitrate binding protein FerR (iron transport regulator)
MKLWFITIFLMVFTAVSNAQDVATIVEYQGKVTIHQVGSPRGEKVSEAPVSVDYTQKVRTYSNSKARIKLKDGSKILVAEKATVDFRDERNIEVKSGRVFFSINKREAAKSLNVITKTAVIGVKGTRFMVEATEDSATVHLEEGVIEVETVEQFKDKMMSEFEAYKRQLNKEFKEYKKVMTMRSGETISVGENGALLLPEPDELNKYYSELEQDF